MAYNTVKDGFYIQAAVVSETLDKEYNISEYIDGIFFRKRFLEDIFPLVVIDIRGTEEIRNIIRDNSSEIYLKITSFDSQTADDSSTIDVEYLPEKDIIFEGNIRLYDKPFTTSSTKKEENEEENDINQTTVIPYVYYRVSGIPEKVIKNNSEIVNILYKNVLLEEVLVNTISRMEQELPIYIETPSNKEAQKTLLLPPMPVSKVPEFLDKYYGLYNGLANSFYDYNRIYIYNYLDPEIENNFNIYVKPINKALSTDEYAYVMKDGNNLKLTLQNLPEFSNDDELTNDSLGSETLYYSYDETFNLSLKSENNSGEFSKIRYFWNGGLYENFENNNSQIMQKDKYMSFAISNINPNLITPLTNLNITSDYEIANGQYLINSLTYKFSTTNRKFYNCTMLINAVKK